MCRILAVLPEYLSLEQIPADVCRAYLLWRGVPITFRKIEPCGFDWDWDRSWERKNSERFEAFWRFQDTSADLWDWLSAHTDTEITARNLLRPWG